MIDSLLSVSAVRKLFPGAGVIASEEPDEEVGRWDLCSGVVWCVLSKGFIIWTPLAL